MGECKGRLTAAWRLRCAAGSGARPFIRSARRYFVARLCVVVAMKLRILTAFLFLPLLPAPAAAGPPVPAGQLLYQKNCGRCHGANGKKGANGAHDLTKSNLNAFGRTYLVTNGLGKMPAFGKTLTPAQVQQVVAYSITLK